MYLILLFTTLISCSPMRVPSPSPDEIAQVRSSVGTVTGGSDQQFLADEVAYAALVTGILSPLRAQLRAQLQGPFAQPVRTLPLQCRRYDYTFGPHPRTGIVEFRRRDQISKSPSESVLFDLTTLRARLGSDAITALRISPSEQTIALVVDHVGSSPLQLVTIDTASGEIKLGPDHVHDIEWGGNDTALFYSVSDNMRTHALRVYLPNSGDSRPVFAVQDPASDILFRRIGNGSRLLIEAGRPRERRWYMIPFASTGEYHPTEITAPEEATLGWEYFHGGLLRAAMIGDEGSVFRLDDSGRERKVLEYAHPRVPEQLITAGEYLVVVIRNAQSQSLEIYDRNFEPVLSIPSSPAQKITLHHHCETPTIRATLSSPVAVPRTVDINPVTRSVHDLAPLKIDPELASTLRETTIRIAWAKSKDGTEIPLTVLTPRSPLRGFLMSAYGAYGVSLDTGFDSRPIMLARHGVGSAWCHARGGGELGPSWHDAGRREGKVKTAQDFVACGELLRTLGEPNHPAVVLYARSAGAAAAARAVLDTPNLFSGVVLDAPFLDVIGQMRDPSLGPTPREHAEWGNPHLMQDAEIMELFSPFRVGSPRLLPPILIQRAIADTLIPMDETVKWMRAIRATVSEPSVMMLALSETAGHSGEPLDYRRDEQDALRYAFLFWVIGP